MTQLMTKLRNDTVSLRNYLEYGYQIFIPETGLIVIEREVTIQQLGRDPPYYVLLREDEDSCKIFM